MHCPLQSSACLRATHNPEAWPKVSTPYIPGGVIVCWLMALTPTFIFVAWKSNILRFYKCKIGINLTTVGCFALKSVKVSVLSSFWTLVHSKYTALSSRCSNNSLSFGNLSWFARQTGLFNVPPDVSHLALHLMATDLSLHYRIPWLPGGLSRLVSVLLVTSVGVMTFGGKCQNWNFHKVYAKAPSWLIFISFPNLFHTHCDHFAYFISLVEAKSSCS